MKVALFISCLTDQFLPRMGIAVVKVLEHLGHTVEFPSAQTCCGQPMYNNGLRSDACDLAVRMVELFDGFDAVVTPSGSCAAMIREHYTALLADDAARCAAAEDLARRTHEFVEFLVRVSRVNLGALGVTGSGTAACHYSCHLRGLGVGHDTPRLAGQVRGLDIVDLPGAHECCGFGGTFAINYPEISTAMLDDKIAAVHATGADTLICNEAGCAMNIGGALHRRGDRLKMTSLAEIIAEGLGLLDREPGI